MSPTADCNPPAGPRSWRQPDDAATGRPTVFLFPGLSGEQDELAALRAECHPALHVIPIQYPDWTEIYDGGIGLDAFVSLCAAQIEGRAGSDPTLLVGYSFGGHMAFATTAALVASGNPVRLLGLIDTHANPPLWTGPLSTGQHLRRLAEAARHGQLKARIGHVAARRLMKLRHKTPLNLFARIRRSRLPPGMGHIDISLQMQFRLLILRTLLDRMQAFPARLDIHATLFRCAEQPVGVAWDLGWTDHLAHLDAVMIPANHFSVTDPQSAPALSASLVSEVAKALGPA